MKIKMISEYEVELVKNDTRVELFIDEEVVAYLDFEEKELICLNEELRIFGFNVVLTG